MKKRTVLSGLVALAAVVACGEQPERVEGASYLLFEAEAQEVGYARLTDEGAWSAVLPQEVAPGEELVIVSPERELRFTAGEAELIRVLGDGTIEQIALDELDLDRVEVDGTEGGIAELADAAPAEIVEPDEDGAVPSLFAPDLIVLLSSVTAPEGVREVRFLPVQLAEEVQLEQEEIAPVAVAPLLSPIDETLEVGPSPLVLFDPKSVLPSGVSTDAPLRSVSGCADPALGTWVSRQYSPIHGGWYEFTLRVRSAGGDRLRGEILSHYWAGSPDDPTEPAMCDPYGEEWTVRMPATGSRGEGRFELGGTSWSVQQRTCGRAPMAGGYLLDHFTGSLTLDGDNLKTVNNDGGVMVDDPTAFVRVACGR